MKKTYKMFAAMVSIAAILFVASCNNGKGQIDSLDYSTAGNRLFVM